MSHNVKLKNNGQYFTVQPGESILEATKRQNIPCHMVAIMGSAVPVYTK